MKFNKGKVRNKIAYSKNKASAILLIWTVPADREDLACLLPIEEGYTYPYGGKFAQSESRYS